ncbi:MAG: RAD55 family ATPase [Nanoarchaeota archaeon]
MANEKAMRLSTGIPGFDNLCESGFIDDSLNLITGNAGAGKTTFLLQFLYNGAVKYKEKGLFVSFELEPTNLHKAASLQGMDFVNLEKKGLCKIIKMSPDNSIKKMQDELMKKIIEEDVKRICFDPINVLSINLSQKVNLRKQLYDLLSFLRSLGVCVLIAGENDGDGSDERDLSETIKFSEYLVDSVIELYSSGIAGEGDRAIRIKKMRMTNHVRGPISFEINDKGVSVYSSSFSNKRTVKKKNSNKKVINKKSLNKKNSSTDELVKDILSRK